MATASRPTTITLFVGTYTGGASRGIYRLDFDVSTGALGEPVLAAEAINPAFLAWHPRLPVLYTVSETDTGPDRQGLVIAFAAADDGSLTAINEQPSGGAAPCYVSVDPSGTRLFVANYHGGSVATLPIDPDGRVLPPSSVARHSGSSVHPVRQRKPYAHSIVPAPTAHAAPHDVTGTSPAAAAFAAASARPAASGSGAQVASSEVAAAAAFPAQVLSSDIADSLQPGSLQPASAEPASVQPGPLQPASWHPPLSPPESLQPGSLHPGSLHPGAALRPASSQRASSHSALSPPESLLPGSLHQGALHQGALRAASSQPASFALAADLGIDRVVVYRIDDGSGLLIPHDAGAGVAAPGAGPRHIAFAPAGDAVFVINELNSTIAAYAWDPARGTLDRRGDPLSTLPDDFTGDNITAEVAVHPDGRFLYASNRGHNSLAIFRIAPDHRLTRIGFQATQGQTPRHFAIDPTGTFLIAANQDSNSLIVFRLDPTTGLLSDTTARAHIPSPACVRFRSHPSLA